MDVAVRFEEKDATVRYLPDRVGLDEIVRRYQDTPFTVSPIGPVVAVARVQQATLRGWTVRPESAEAASDTEPDTNAAASSVPQPIEIFVEVLRAKERRIASPPRLVLADTANVLVELRDEFEEVKTADESKPRRFVARAVETVTLRAGDVTIPIGFHVLTAGEDNEEQAVEGTLGIVLRTPGTQQSVAAPAGDVALIDGELELQLGHLCDQEGCVDHLHRSLGEIPGLGAVRPHPSMEAPRATVYLRARQPVDVWSLREELRGRSIEVAGMVPGELPPFRLRVELPRWRVDKESVAVEQCLVCRDGVAKTVEDLAWVERVDVSGGGVNVRPVTRDVDLVELLDAVCRGGTAPLSVWLLPQGAAMPKAAAPRLARRDAMPKLGGSNAHPVVELDFAHTCDVGTNLLTLLGERAWASRTHLEVARETTIARAAIGDRKSANVTMLLDELRSAGPLPSQIRLSQFGDVRLQLQFAHICGHVEYSKPPEKKDEDKEKEEEESEDEPPAKTKPNREATKPFVPVPLRPDQASNGRQAIEAALARVDFVKEGVFHDYHTKPEFNGPRKLTLAFATQGGDVVGLEKLILELRSAGFPPTSLLVSRRFPGIPFGERLPGDLLVTSRDGKRYPLASLQQPSRPLAVAFVSLECERYEKYNPDPQLYEHLTQTVEQYKDRVDFVALSANPDDKFGTVAEFWDKTGVGVPLLHDSDGSVRGVFNSQATPPPHLFVFDGDARLRYAGDPHDSWESPEKRQDDFLASALELVLAGNYQANGAVFFNKPVCNCSDPNCKCPKCGCGSTCRCAIKH